MAKKKETVQTRLNEVRTTTDNLADMLGQYAARHITRTWIEDFIDEDTGEIVSLDRNEVIVLAGTYIDADIAARISFHQLAGDIVNVEISNQMRQGFMSPYDFWALWSTSIETAKQTRKLILYADSVKTALAIIEDYMELSCGGWFKIKSISRLGDFSTLIHDPQIGKNDYKDADCEYYKIEVGITEIGGPEGFEQSQSFLLRTKDVDTGAIAIKDYIANKSTEAREYNVVIKEGGTLKCHAIIDAEFSKMYLEANKPPQKPQEDENND